MFGFKKKADLPEREPVKTADKEVIMTKLAETKAEFVGKIPDHSEKLSPHLNEDQKLDLISKLAMYWKAPRIVTYFKEVYGLHITDWAITRYKQGKEWQLVMDRMRSQYIAGILEVPIANKRWRIEEYAELYDALKELGEHSQAAKILSMVQDEMEEKKGSVQNIFMTQVNVTDEELLEEKSKTIQQLEIVRKKKQLGQPKGDLNVESTSSL